MDYRSMDKNQLVEEFLFQNASYISKYYFSNSLFMYQNSCILYNLADVYSLWKIIFLCVLCTWVCILKETNSKHSNSASHLKHSVFTSALPLEHMGLETIMPLCLEITQQRQNYEEVQMMKNQNSHFAIQPVSHFLFLFDLASIINVQLARRYLRKQNIMQLWKNHYSNVICFPYKTWNSWQRCTNLN